MSELLGIDDVSVHFPAAGGKFVRAVQNVSLAIEAGETLALVGESGSGKSTLGYTVAGLQAPTSGTLRFEGDALTAKTWPAARRKIQIVFQDPFGALDPRMPISAIIAEPLLIQRIGTAETRRARAAELINQVGLPRDALNRYLHEFSGGQRQRIAIARALSPAPRLIVADEPLSALDVSIQSQVLNLMKEVQEARGLSYLFISHDLAVVNHLVDRVAVLYLGRLVEVADRALLFANPAHPYTSALLDAVPRIGRRRARQAGTIKGEMPSPLNPPSGCVFHTRCPRAEPVCAETVPELRKLRPGQSAACHFPLDTE
jgi:oligopeptide/dipeptide ABC transporter ATP-binding protein